MPASPITQFDTDTFVSKMKTALQAPSALFQAGCLKPYFPGLATLTSDPYIVSAVSGYKLEFTHTPGQLWPPKPIAFAASESAVIDETIQKILAKRIIVPSFEEPGQFASTSLFALNSLGPTVWL